MELIQNRTSQYKELAPVLKEHEETLDVIVPDVNPDVLNILYTDGACTLRERQVGSGTVTLLGDLFVRVFYSSEEEGGVHSVTGQIPYSYSYEAAGAQAGNIALVNVSVLGAGALALNPRKLTLKAELAVDVRLFQPSDLELVSGAEGEPEEGIQVYSCESTLCYLADLAEKKIAFNEEIRLLPSGVGQNDRLVRSELTWVCEDVKTLENKAMVRGTALVKIVTLPEGGRGTAENTYKLPFSQIIESDSMEAGDTVDIAFQTLQFDTQLITRGDDELYLYCNIFGNAAAMVKKQAEITLLEDMFSTAYDLTYETAEIAGGLGEPVTLSAEAGLLIELEAPAAQICDVNVCARARATADGVLGSFYFKVLYIGQSGRVCSAGRRAEVEVPAEGLCPGSYVEAAAENVTASIDAAGSIQITFRAAFGACGQSGTPRRYIQSAALDTESPKGRARDASLVLRAIEAGESVWSVAKQYRTAPDAILSANKLDDARELKPGKLVIIPFVQ